MKSLDEQLDLFDRAELVHESKRLTIKRGSHALLVSYKASWIEYFWLFYLIVLAFLPVLVGSTQYDFFLFLFFIVVIPFWSLKNMFSLTTLIDLDRTYEILIKKHGLFGTRLNSSMVKLTKENVTDVVVSRYPGRLRTSYQVGLRVDGSRTVPVTGVNITSEDAQNCNDAIRKTLQLRDRPEEID